MGEIVDFENWKNKKEIDIPSNLKEIRVHRFQNILEMIQFDLRMTPLKIDSQLWIVFLQIIDQAIHEKWLSNQLCDKFLNKLRPFLIDLEANSILKIIQYTIFTASTKGTYLDLPVEEVLKEKIVDLKNTGGKKL